MAYVPAPIPDRLTFVTVATPEPSVELVPAAAPFKVKLIVLPVTPVPLDVKVADRVVVPPYVPDAAETASEVGAAAFATRAKFCTVVRPELRVTEAVPVV
jgi:hypothetical protein